VSDLAEQSVLGMRLRAGVLVALVVAGVATVLCIIYACFAPGRFMLAYLYAYMFWLGMSLGGLGLVMLAHCTGGEWAYPIRRLAETAAAVMPLMLLLFIPIAFGIPKLYPWFHPAAGTHLAGLRVLLDHYLNTPYFLTRSAAYLIIWCVMAWALYLWSLKRDRTSDRRLSIRMHNLSAVGVVIYFFTMTFASVDWVMSRDAPWKSTIFGFVITMGQVLSAVCFLTIVLALVCRYRPFKGRIIRGHFNDVGNLLLVMVILWAYMNFVQYLIIWTGNTSGEIPWFVTRSTGGWMWISVLLIVFHFFAPFFILLIRQVKRRIGVMGTLAAILLLLHLMDVLWVVAPSGVLGEPNVRWLWIELLTPVAVGGWWMAAYLWLAAGRPILADRPPGEPVVMPGRYHNEYETWEAI
jgi:hypothetical protein